jgi:hypothetical protein
MTPCTFLTGQPPQLPSNLLKGLATWSCLALGQANPPILMDAAWTTECQLQVNQALWPRSEPCSSGTFPA